jgi:RNA polymerase sigma-70 factor (ECF subfamily)
LKTGDKSRKKDRKSEALSDGEVVRRVRAGESRLLELLFRRHGQRVYRIARAIVRDDAEAADVVQETYLRAYNHLDQFAGRARFSTWLAKIAVHSARERARRHTRRETMDFVPADEGKPVGEPAAIAADPEKEAFGKEVKAILEAAIDELPDGYRTVFMLREIEEMTTAETAECLNLSRDTVKTRLHRARLLLQEKLHGSVGARGANAFRFAGARCDRMIQTLVGARREGFLERESSRL